MDVTEDAAWEVGDFSISPDGLWAAVSAVSSTKPPGCRLFLIDIERGGAREVRPTPDAVARILTEPRPGLRAAEWTPTELRFPAPRVEPENLWVRGETGETYREPGTVIGSRSWYSVSLAGGGTRQLELDESPDAASREIRIPKNVDARLDVRAPSRGALEVVDTERGSRPVARFRGLMVWLDVRTATISPGGNWVGLTLAREAFGSMGPRGFVVPRDGGERIELGDGIYSPLAFHPTRREVYGVSEGLGPRRALVRWRF